MKFVLSKNLKIFVSPDKFLVVLSSGQNWFVNKSVIEFLMMFLEPQIIPNIVSHYKPEEKMIVDIIDKLIQREVLVPDNNKCEFFASLIQIKDNPYFTIYADIVTNESNEACVFFEESILDILDRFGKGLDIKLQKFSVCVYSKDKNFMTSGQGLPHWASGFANKNCLFLSSFNFYEKYLEKNFVTQFLRALSHELGHIATYQNNYFLPNWFAEGVSEHIATQLFPKFSSKVSDLIDTSVNLDFFFGNPDKQLIKYNSNKPVFNGLYYQAKEHIKNLTKHLSINEVLEKLREYRLSQPIQEYFLQG